MTAEPTPPLPLPLEKLVIDRFGAPNCITALPLHASPRQRWRIELDAAPGSIIAVFNPSDAENRAFWGFTKMFSELGLDVPELYAVDERSNTYLEEDLGRTTLYDILLAHRAEIDSLTLERSQDSTAATYCSTLLQKSLHQLANFQVRAAPLIDRELCYQGAVFDAAAIGRDLTRFTREFLSRLLVGESLSTFTSQVAGLQSAFAPLLSDQYFMYRDFQSRNIMVREERLTFIDFQSGRLGPPEYDAVSFLYQARIELPKPLKYALFKEYVGVLTELSPKSNKVTQDQNQRLDNLPWFVALRALQTLGAYGEFGLGQGKEHFLRSIPAGLNNLSEAAQELPKTVGAPLLLMIAELSERLAERPSV